MLVLLVPRELQVEHSGSVKEMTDQQIEDAIAAIKQMIAEAGKKPLKRL
jgi:galactose-1-phosphate uridylyltransferase